LISSNFAVAAFAIAIFSDKSIPTLFTNSKRILIVQYAVHTAHSTVAPVKLRMVKTNIVHAGRDLSPRRLQMEVRPPLKSAVCTGTDKVVCAAMKKTITDMPDAEGLVQVRALAG
jgi:hypothetical protein